MSFLSCNIGQTFWNVITLFAENFICYAADYIAPSPTLASLWTAQLKIHFQLNWKLSMLLHFVVVYLLFRTQTVLYYKQFIFFLRQFENNIYCIFTRNILHLPSKDIIYNHLYFSLRGFADGVCVFSCLSKMFVYIHPSSVRVLEQCARRWWWSALGI